MINNFLIVDDDRINNMLCDLVIQNDMPGAIVETFTDASVALQHMSDAGKSGEAVETLVFLDINMPEISGWEFLDAFDHFDQCVKNKFKICMLSSSVDYNDREKARKNKNVFDYLIKPLTTDNIFQVLKQVSTIRA